MVGWREELQRNTFDRDGADREIRRQERLEGLAPGEVHAVASRPFNAERDRDAAFAVAEQVVQE